MGQLLKGQLRIEKAELLRLLWMLLFGIFLGIAVSILDVAVVSGFLLSYDNSYLPGAIICSGLLGIFTANTFISIQNWISYTKVASLALTFLIVLCLFTYIVPDHNPSSTALYIGFVLTGPVNVLALLIFWGLFEKLFDVAQVRRFSVVGESGWIIASAAALIFIALTGNEYFRQPFNLYVISFYSFIFSLVVLFLVSYFNSFLTKVIINVQYIKAYNNYKKLIRQPYILLLAAFAFLSAMVFYLTDYTFLIVSKQQCAKNDLLTFLSGFTAAALLVGFLIQIFIVNWVNSKYGYLVSLLVLPALLGLFTAIYSVLGTLEGYDKEKSVFFFLFMLICISKLLSSSLFRSVEFSTFKFFFMPLDNLLRSDIQSKIERVVRESGKVIAAIVIATVCYYLKFEYLPYFILGIMAVWSFVTVKMNLAYREKLKVSLDDREVIEKKEKVSTGIVGDLVKMIASSDGKEIEVYLSLLKVLDPVRYKECILKLIEHDNESIQEIALYEASELCLLTALPVLDRVIESKYYPVLRTRDLIDKVYSQLKAAEFRLEKVKYIEQLTLSKLRKERVYGALLAAYSEDSIKPRLLNKLFRDADPKVRFGAVVSSAGSKSSDLQKNLIEKLGDCYFSNAALASVTTISEEMFPVFENAFYLTGQEEKIQLRIVQAYGRIGTDNAIQLLLKKLSYTNQNVSRAAFEALSNSGYNITGERVLQFKAELEEYVSVLVWNMSAYLDLVYYKSSQVLLQAMLSEMESNFSSIFKLLTLLYEPKTIALIKENIFSKDPEKREYAFGLLEVTLADEIKPFLLPVLSHSSFEEKVAKMQDYFPTEPIHKVDVLYDLIQRDYKFVNRWTKACALKELAEEKEEVDNDIFLANVINPDSLLKETASVALYIKAPGLFPDTFERFRRELGTGFSKEVVNKILLNKSEEDSAEEITVSATEKAIGNKGVKESIDYFAAPNLRFEIIKFLNGIEEFRHIPGIVLMEVARITEFFRFNAGDAVAQYEGPDLLDYFLVRSGQVDLYKEDVKIASFNERSLIHNFQLLTCYDEKIKIVASTDCEVYKIKQEEFNEAMSFFEEIPRSIIKGIKIAINQPQLALTD